jgi:hypothetical protein
MARAIMGGLAFSAVISLLIVPMFYVWFDELNTWRRRVFSGSAAGTSPEAARPASIEDAAGSPAATR